VLSKLESTCTSTALVRMDSIGVSGRWWNRFSSTSAAT